MKTVMNRLALTHSLWIALLFPMLAACGTETPTRATVVNGYAEAGDGAPAAQLVVYRVWYSTTLFRDPVLPKASSGVQRIVPGSDEAYAVLTSHWDPASGDTPRAFIPVRSRRALSVARGDVLQIVVSDATFVGRCDGEGPLTQSQADFITTRIFPAEFTGVHYDAATCTAETVSDAGAASPMESGVPVDAARDAPSTSTE
jgi:hypothetical protein